MTAAGAALFQANCASCHGAAGAGTQYGPALLESGAAAADFYLRTGRMPLGAPNQPAVRQVQRLSPAEVQALVAHVGSLGGPAIPQVTQDGDLVRGRSLFIENCAACHGATGAGNAVGGGFNALSLGEADTTEIAEAMLIGPGAMPRFQLAQPDRDAVIAYVVSLRTATQPGGYSIGGVGPVAEGFVALFLGVGSLLLIARRVGAAAHPVPAAGEGPATPEQPGPDPGPETPP